MLIVVSQRDFLRLVGAVLGTPFFICYSLESRKVRVSVCGQRWGTSRCVRDYSSAGFCSPQGTRLELLGWLRVDERLVFQLQGSAIMRFLSLKRQIICLIAVAANLCAAQQQALPTITSISPEQIKDIGEGVTLECDIDNVGKFTVGWQKTNRERSQNVNSISLGPTLAVAEDRFTVNVDKKNNTMNYTLTISDIVNTDAGLYECQIQVNSTSKVTATVELQVRHPPLLLDNLMATTVTKAEGEDAKLTCTAEGYPRPSISWKREYGAILPIGGQSFLGNELSLPALSREDRGTYFCNADNGVGKPDSRTINLEVEFAPVISVPRPKIAQATEYDIELECVVQAFPSPAVSWFKNGHQIHNGGSYGITQTGQPDDVTTSTVKITSVESSHYGDYICKASNKVGHAEARLNLYESVIPVPF